MFLIKIDKENFLHNIACFVFPTLLMVFGDSINNIIANIFNRF